MAAPFVTPQRPAPLVPNQLRMFPGAANGMGYLHMLRWMVGQQLLNQRIGGQQ